MNTTLILSMAQTYEKDNAITYDEFDRLFSDLSRKEQYEVVNLLYENGIDLIDEHVENEASILDLEDDSSIESLWDGNSSTTSTDSFFRDPGYKENQFDDLLVNTVVHQSNEILCSQIQQGNRQAAQDLCVKNKALVDKYVNGYLKKYGNELDFEDLEQVGFLGLLKAAEKFDRQICSSFSTYAVIWIKQTISREIMDNGFIIRIPVHMMERINKVTEAEYRCPNDASSNEKIQFIADDLGLNEKEVRECITLRANVLSHTSLATAIGEDEDSELVDFIPADIDPDPVATAAMNQALRDALDKVLCTLTPREQRVLRLRNGWDGRKPMTLEQVGKEFNVTRERIRQIEAKAIRKLRHRSRIKIIQDFREV